MTLDQLYAEAVPNNVVVRADKEVEGSKEIKEDEGTGSRDSSVPHFAKDQCKSPYANRIREDVTTLGCDLLSKKDIVAVREEKRRISEQKSLLRECIVNHLSQQAVNNPVNFFEPTPHLGL